MKYIRTKNGNILNSSRGLTSMIVTKDDILKEADTIEELCDMFIFRAGDYIVIDQDKDKVFRGNWNCYDTIYGAIWTNKGLIYAAKMNDKGEFELI